MEKYYNEDGHVGVVISPGFGAGWSTWAEDDIKLFCTMDKTIVEMALASTSSDDVKKYIEDKFGKDQYIYIGWWNDVEVVFLPVGTAFYINEYDGHESLKTADDLWMVA